MPDHFEPVRGTDFDKSRQNVWAIPQEGSITLGFDADIVLWDPNRKETIRQELMHHGADYTPYDGIEVTGWSVMTFLGGKKVMENGEILGALGDSAFFRRDSSPYAALANRTEP